MERKPELTPDQRNELFRVLTARFEKHTSRHPGLEWASVMTRLEAAPEKIWSLHEMELTGGEPDVIGYDEKTGEYLFCDCSAESPSGRRSLCYDRKGQTSRKDNVPDNNAVDLAADMGVDLLTEEQYRALQNLGSFDLKTSGWLKTPEAVRQLGGALFGDYRYGRVFIYHNGASSYYSARGFRGLLSV